MNEDNEECKSLLIVNESNDAKVTLYIYRTWLPIPTISKVIQPNERYLHREKQMFKFKLVANFDDERKEKEFPGPLELIRDTLIRVTKSLKLIKENLADYPQTKQICLRKMPLKNELPNTSGKVNLYDILGLDMEVVRKLNIDDQKKAINEAFRDQIRISHPDKNGDDETAMQIIVAKEILLNDERRARYHNETDYDKGWLSHQQLQAIFWPDCYTEEQNKAYWRRIGLMAKSSGLAIGGGVVTALTAGLAAPVVAVCGILFGGGLIGAGIQSGMYTITKDSVLNECDTKSHAIEADIGFVRGVRGGVAALVKTRKQPEEATALTKTLKQPEEATALTKTLKQPEEATALTKTLKQPEEATALTKTLKQPEEATALTKTLKQPEEATALTKTLKQPEEATALTKTLKQPEEATALTKTLKQPEEATFRCKSKGVWNSKMIITYLLNGKQIKGEVNGSGGTVKIPLDAKQVEVRFQVRRLFYRNIIKYDRFTKTWCKPYEPHVFRYEKPPLERTFTISGYLGWEAVMRVSDEHHEETGEMVGYILKTDMKTAGKYLSLMSALYFSLCSL